MKQLHRQNTGLSTKYLAIGVAVMITICAAPFLSDAAELPGVGGDLDQCYTDRLNNLQACTGGECGGFGFINCCNDAWTIACYAALESEYRICKGTNGGNPNPYIGLSFGGLSHCVISGVGFLEPTVEGELQVCWQDSDGYSVWPPATVESVDFYTITSASFDAQWAADSTLTGIDFDFLGAATANPLPDTAPEEKTVSQCYGWSAPVSGSSFMPDTSYRVFAVIRDSAVPVDSLDVITGTMFVTEYLSAADDDDLQRHAGPAAVKILATTPNPFNPSMELSFASQTSTALAMEVYDVSGKLVRRVPLGSIGVGDHRVRWDGRDQDGRAMSSGVYFLRVQSPVGDSQMAKVALVR